MADAARVRRLRAAVVSVPPETLRAVTARIGEDVIRALPGPARPLANQLRRSSDPAALLRRLPNPTLLGVLADVIDEACLDRTRELLGDAADDPTMDQLRAALDVVVEEFDVSIVRVMLASVATADAEAADLCDELLRTDARFALPDDEVDGGSSGRAGAKAGPSEEVLARRRERKEAEKARKAAERAKGGSRPKR